MSPKRPAGRAQKNYKKIGMSRTVMAFGTFDVFHPGHEYYLQQAAKL